MTIKTKEELIQICIDRMDECMEALTSSIRLGSATKDHPSAKMLESFKHLHNYLVVFDTVPIFELGKLEDEEKERFKELLEKVGVSDLAIKARQDEFPGPIEP